MLDSRNLQTQRVAKLHWISTKMWLLSFYAKCSIISLGMFSLSCHQSCGKTQTFFQMVNIRIWKSSSLAVIIPTRSMGATCKKTFSSLSWPGVHKWRQTNLSARVSINLLQTARVKSMRLRGGIALQYVKKMAVRIYSDLICCLSK